MLTTSSPHIGIVQSTLHAADSPASSQSSPAVMLSCPSPHVASVQSGSHSADSPSSSHASPAVTLSRPSPHTGSVQSMSQVAVSPPSSQASGPSIRPSPQLLPEKVSSSTTMQPFTLNCTEMSRRSNPPGLSKPMKP